jgi:hypothetical protein
MSLRFAAIGVLAGLAAPAMAQFNTVDRALVGLHYFHDYEPAGQSTVNVTSAGNGLTLLQFDQTFNVVHGGASRHVGELSNNPNAPISAPNTEPWDFSATVSINTLSAKEGGLHIGHLGTNWPPGDMNAVTGVFDVIPDSGEIAVFGAWLPFWSNNLPGYQNFPRATRNTPTTLRMVFEPSNYSFTYFVNGMQAGPFFLDAAGITFYNSFPGQSLGVFAQNTPANVGDVATTVFTNLHVTIPAPGSLALLGLGGALAFRRRR